MVSELSSNTLRETHCFKFSGDHDVDIPKRNRLQLRFSEERDRTEHASLLHTAGQ